MKRMPQPIPYQGSKRNIAEKILSVMPDNIGTLIEPFAGSAAISVRSAYANKAQRFHLNDLNKPLMNLFDLIINEPENIASDYAKLWERQIGRERKFYDEVRAEFNQTGRPDQFLYLLARCVKASVRYNASGEFNQAPDNRRKGRHPNSMRSEIDAVSQLLKDKTEISSCDFTELLDKFDPTTDLIYMDPPYQGTSGRRDSRYCSGIDISSLIDFIAKLNEREAMFIVSYDGRKGARSYGEALPEDLNLVHIEIEAGRSTQSTLMGKDDITYESLYLSSTVADRLALTATGIENLTKLDSSHTQLELTFA